MENIIEQLENKDDRVIDIIEDKIKKFDDRLWIEYPDDKNEISNEVFRYITYEGILDYSEICSTYIRSYPLMCEYKKKDYLVGTCCLFENDKLTVTFVPSNNMPGPMRRQSMKDTIEILNENFSDIDDVDEEFIIDVLRDWENIFEELDDETVKCDNSDDDFYSISHVDSEDNIDKWNEFQSILNYLRCSVFRLNRSEMIADKIKQWFLKEMSEKVNVYIIYGIGNIIFIRDNEMNLSAIYRFDAYKFLHGFEFPSNNGDSLDKLIQHVILSTQFTGDVDVKKRELTQLARKIFEKRDEIDKFISTLFFNEVSMIEQEFYYFDHLREYITYRYDCKINECNSTVEITRDDFPGRANVIVPKHIEEKLGVIENGREYLKVMEQCARTYPCILKHRIQSKEDEEFDRMLSF